MNAHLVTSRRNGDRIPKHVHSSVNVRKLILLGRCFANLDKLINNSSYFPRTILRATACNCFGHSNACDYDEDVDNQGLSLDIHGRFAGGGVCKNCDHNTEGINCNKCQSKYYRPYGKHWNETDVCKCKMITQRKPEEKKIFKFDCRIFSACNCDSFFSTGNCEEESGRCECRPEFQAPDCQDCSYGHFGYPNCRPCECNLLGSTGDQCQATNGICSCKPNFAGDFCNRCADGYYGTDCLPCNCDLTGSLNDVCDAINGQCPCSSQFDGKLCDRCKDGYFGFPSCPCKSKTKHEKKKRMEWK